MTEQQTILIVDDSIDDITLLREGFRQVDCTSDQGIRGLPVN